MNVVSGGGGGGGCKRTEFLKFIFNAHLRSMFETIRLYKHIVNIAVHIFEICRHRHRKTETGTNFILVFFSFQSQMK